MALIFGLVLELLVLITVANGAPVLLARLVGARWAWPVDGGLHWRDGRPLLGRSKTVRGLVSAVLATAVVAVAFGHPWQVGALFGAAAMLGDLFSSFVKRRCAIPPSGRATGLDQIPEALLPLLGGYRYFGLDAVTVIVVVALFTIGSLLASPIMHWLGIRERPY